MASKARESKSLLEVWEWKKDAWEEVKHLDLESAIRKRLRDSENTAKRLKRTVLAPTPPRRRAG